MTSRPQNATIGSPFTEMQVRQLPLQTRNVVELLALQPGVTATGQVIGNIVTPIPVTLDGQQRSIEIPMADIAYTVYGAGDTMTLQITSSALPYANLTAWGFIDISDVSLEVPTVADDG